MALEFFVGSEIGRQNQNFLPKLPPWIVATGKEAVVIHATGGQPPEEIQMPIPGELAVKVFKTTLNEFKNRQDYIANDYRDEFENIKF